AAAAVTADAAVAEIATAAAAAAAVAAADVALEAEEAAIEAKQEAEYAAEMADAGHGAEAAAAEAAAAAAAAIDALTAATLAGEAATTAAAAAADAAFAEVTAGSESASIAAAQAASAADAATVAAISASAAADAAEAAADVAASAAADATLSLPADPSTYLGVWKRTCVPMDDVTVAKVFGRHFASLSQLDQFEVVSKAYTSIILQMYWTETLTIGEDGVSQHWSFFSDDQCQIEQPVVDVTFDANFDYDWNPLDPNSVLPAPSNNPLYDMDGEIIVMTELESKEGLSFLRYESEFFGVLHGQLIFNVYNNGDTLYKVSEDAVTPNIFHVEFGKYFVRVGG
ncbi:MAG: hypothetical protein COA99_09985, partial [Moraxellaceae bacterium]